MLTLMLRWPRSGPRSMGTEGPSRHRYAMLQGEANTAKDRSASGGGDLVELLERRVADRDRAAFGVMIGDRHRKSEAFGKLRFERLDIRALLRLRFRRLALCR